MEKKYIYNQKTQSKLTCRACFVEEWIFFSLSLSKFLFSNLRKKEINKCMANIQRLA